jgi:hypothetical protein
MTASSVVKGLILSSMATGMNHKNNYFYPMQLSKNQWFGLITFIVLIIAAYLVTTEPWNKSSRNESPMEDSIDE